MMIYDVKKKQDLVLMNQNCSFSLAVSTKVVQRNLL